MRVLGPRTADNHDNVRPTNGPDIQTIKYAYTSARARAVTVNVSQDSMRTKEGNVVPWTKVWVGGTSKILMLLGTGKRAVTGKKAASTEAIGGEVRSAFLSSTILSRVICQQCPPLVSCI